MPVSPETLALVNAFKSPIVETLSDIKKEVSFFFDDGILNYVQNFKDKYEFTKTFLFRSEKVSFYDTYYPVTIRNSKEKLNIDDLSELFKETNFLSIIGTAGSGKSILMKHIFLQSIMQIFQVPIVIELRNLNHYKGTFMGYVHDAINCKKLAPTKKILNRILENGNFLFLLDGYDEIFSENKEKISREIEDFTDRYNKNLFVLTSRPGANAEVIPRFESCVVKPLTSSQVKDFTKKQLMINGDEKLAEKIIEVIDKPENKEYTAYLSSPLLLSMFIMTFKSYPELPKLKSKFYWNVYDTLCTKHDSFTKQGGYQHERVSGLRNEEISSILEWFSYLSLFEGKYNIDEQYLRSTLLKIVDKLNLECEVEKVVHDLVVSISIIIIDGLEYRFPHKSLQEYFAVLLIKSLPREIREKIYNSKFESSHRLSRGGDLNIWDLCNEMDSVCFNKFFVLPNLEMFMKEIDTSSKQNKVYSFFKYSNFTQGFNRENGSCHFSSHSYYSKTALVVIEYLKVAKMSQISLLAYEKSQKLIEILIDKDYVSIKSKGDEEEVHGELDYASKWDSTLFSFVDSIGLADKIIELIDKVDSEIEILKWKIEMQEKNTASLLDL